MREEAEWRYGKDLARAAGGAVLFAAPLLMTMAMWWLGFYMNRLHLALFVGLGVFMLIGLSRRTGFSQNSRWFDDICDAFSAYGVGVFIALGLLVLFGVLDRTMPLSEWVGKVAIQSVPAGDGRYIGSITVCRFTAGQ